MRRGVTLVELIVSAAVIIIIGLLGFSNLSGRPGKVELDTTAQKAAGLLREAQSRSMNQSGNVQWGVHFDNVSTSSPYFVLFSGSAYSTTTAVSRNQLSRYIQFATSSLPVGSSTDIIFSKIYGAPNRTTTSTVGFEWWSGTTLRATTSVIVNGGGLISIQ